MFSRLRVEKGKTGGPGHCLTVTTLVLFFVAAILFMFRLSYEDDHERLVNGPRKRGPNLRCTDTPYLSTWGSWLHPYRVSGSEDLMRGDWNILYHLGGNGPWIEKVDGVAHGGIGVPEGCRVEQVHMMSRHAERYPTINAGARMFSLLDRIHRHSEPLVGALSFVNNWTYFSADPSQTLEQLTDTGPYAGTLEAFATGVKLRTRYAHLLPAASPAINGSRTQLWASGSQRVIDTASYFATGMFGLTWPNLAHLNIIPETSSLGADTLTPGDTCLRYDSDTVEGHDKGAIMLSRFQSSYLPAIRARLRRENPQLPFFETEIYSMQEMCGFETLVRGSSPWCDVFTEREWIQFEYARDLNHFYRSGPGNKYGATMGWLWLNATASLLAQGPEAGPLFFSFVHDGDIVPMLAALDLFGGDDELPTTHVKTNRAWKTSQITPMGGRVIFERLACAVSSKATTARAEIMTNPHEEVFVRINVNDGIIPFGACHSGPGGSCPLAEYLGIIRRQGAALADFRTLCGLPANAADHISFLHQ